MPRPVAQIGSQYDAHIIPEGLPRVGNVLRFDNHGEAIFPPVSLEITGEPRVILIDPTKKQLGWE